MIHISKDLHMRYLFLFLLAFGFISCDKEKPETKLAQAIYIQPQEYIEKASFYGIMQARQSSPLVAQADGVLDWQAKPGDELNKEAIIAHIANPEITKEFDLATAAEEIARQQYNRSLTLSKNNATSKQQLQEREQELIKTQQALAKAELGHKKTKFFAPFDGIVGPNLIHEGTYVKSGDIIGHFFDPKDLIVEVQIPVGFKNSLMAGQAVVIENSKYTLPLVPKMLNPETNMMVIHIPVKDLNALIGEVIDVMIHLKVWGNAVVIPLTAIKFEENIASILTIKEGNLEKRTITIGPKDAQNAVILTGLSIGETLCLDPHHFYEGETVTPKYPML